MKTQNYDRCSIYLVNEKESLLVLRHIECDNPMGNTVLDRGYGINASHRRLEMLVSPDIILPFNAPILWRNVNFAICLRKIRFVTWKEPDLFIRN